MGNSSTAKAKLFVFHASGFPNAGVSNTEGHVLRLDSSRPGPVAEGLWVAIDYDADTTVWFNSNGRILNRMGYSESKMRFARHPADPDQSPLWQTWSRQGTALVGADGRVATPWQREAGDWRASAHPERLVWKPQRGDSIIFDWQGRKRIPIQDGQELLVSGPFPKQALYLICSYDRSEICTLRDEQDATRFQGHIDELIELDGGGWLARWGNLWRRLNADGEPVGDKAYTNFQYFPHFRTQASVKAPAWPLWMTAYSLDGETVRTESAVKGLMQPDGQFYPTPGITHVHELCQGTWRATNDDINPAEYWLVDNRGQRIAGFPYLGSSNLEEHPDWLLVGTQRSNTLINCRGELLFQDPQIQHLEPLGSGFAGTLAGDTDLRLWLDASLNKHVLPAGSDVLEVDDEGRLLLVRVAGAKRLYNLKLERFVGTPFDAGENLSANGLIFLRGGAYGYMNAEGEVILPAEYSELVPWGEDRIWARRYLSEGSQLSLHDGTGRLIGSWPNSHVSTSPWNGDNGSEETVAPILGDIFYNETGSYFTQQWVDRNGHPLLIALWCRYSNATEGGLLESRAGQVYQHGAKCEMSAEVREAITMHNPSR